MSNVAAAREAEKEFGAEIRIIKKTSQEYAREKDPPPCPSVMLDGKFIVKNDTVTSEVLKTAITGSNGTEA